MIIAADRRIKGLADSKVLTPEQREALFSVIHERAVAVGVGIVDHETIDRINILQATKLAMADALARLAVKPDFVITDFVALRDLPCPQKNLVDGDARCATVAAASIVAKVTRDRLMVEADRRFPEYGLDHEPVARDLGDRVRCTGAPSPASGVRASCSSCRQTTSIPSAPRAGLTRAYISSRYVATRY